MKFTGQIICFLVLATMMSTAAQSATTKVQKQARELCAVFNPDAWKSYDGESYFEFQAELSNRISKAISGGPIFKVFNKLATDTQVNDYYAYIETAISKLIGKPWHCENMAKYYSVSWKDSTQEARTNKAK